MRLGTAVLFGALLVPAASACGPRTSPETRSLDLPEAPPDARTGRELARALGPLWLEDREELIVSEVASGNVPEWLRTLEPVELDDELDGSPVTVRFWVTRDYLAIGPAADYLTVPLSPLAAQRIADLLDASLPTPRMVDAIWREARSLSPITIGPDSLITSVRYFARHSRLVLAQRFMYEVPSDAFVAGHKVDVVLTPRLAEVPGYTAVYGWHRLNGEPIQPLFTASAWDWVDYTRGVRLVDREILIEGVAHDLTEVLEDPALASLLSEEGAMDAARYPVQGDSTG